MARSDSTITAGSQVFLHTFSSSLSCLILHALCTSPHPLCHLHLHTLHPPPPHHPPLCPLTTWHLFRFIPISWQTVCFSPAGHNAAILMNQWQINQCYLFFPCLCCHWFFFSLLLYCFWSLELCSIKLSSLLETNCKSVRLRRQTLMLAPDGAWESFIYEKLHSGWCSSDFCKGSI